MTVDEFIQRGGAARFSPPDDDAADLRELGTGGSGWRDESELAKADEEDPERFDGLS